MYRIMVFWIILNVFQDMCACHVPACSREDIFSQPVERAPQSGLLEVALMTVHCSLLVSLNERGFLAEITDEDSWCAPLLCILRQKSPS